jgi:hypothetical protein
LALQERLRIDIDGPWRVEAAVEQRDRILTA